MIENIRRINTMGKTRFNWLDIMKFIGMWMIFAIHSHHAWTKQFEFVTLQLFFFSAGLFASKGLESDFRKFLLTGLRRLMVPYLIFVVISAGLHRMLYDASGKTLLIEILLGCRDHLPCATLWFLPSLFCGRLAFYLCFRLAGFARSERSRLCMMGALVFAVWAVCSFARYKMLHINIAGSYTWCLPWSADWAGIHLPWYFAGYLLFDRINAFHFKDLSVKGKILLVFITLISLVYSVWSFIDPEVLNTIADSVRIPSVLVRSLFTTILLGLPMFFVILVISKLLNRFDFPARVGQETLWMCCFEEIFIFILLTVRQFTGLVIPGWTLDPAVSQWTGFLFALFEMLFMYFLLIPVFKKTVAKWL